LLGLSTGHATIGLLGIGGALLHMLNHSIFKSLLFLGAGSVLHATGTRKLDELGGLLKQMPWTGIAFCVGAIAICGLPPFNGFVGEWLIYAGAFHGLLSLATQDTMWFVLAIAGLAFIGGLAVACFTRAFGAVFLGTPRQPRQPIPHESEPMMLIPMALLAGTCLAIGLMPWQVMRLVMPAVSVVTKNALPWTHESLSVTMTGLTMLSAVAASFLCVMLALVLLRRRLLRHRQMSHTVTWGCGYAMPTAKMQYTASSFSEPLTRLFRRILGTSFREQRPGSYFPVTAHLASHTPDVIKEQGFLPVFAGARRGLQQLRWIQQGRVQLYLAYIFTALIVLLVWKLGV
jgi:NADH:ubiquinone oxidoreductase subunit 5 (subunit L)/multisubunit Na+/H+ antiporter MnhA subunit